MDISEHAMFLALPTEFSILRKDKCRNERYRLLFLFINLLIMAMSNNVKYNGNWSNCNYKVDEDFYIHHLCINII